ncbi:entry exclusion lipoprotein TrbK [Acinetobacter sp. Ac_3412]|uniref:entry exclusion lipoprotein TrbK n=1 Tax=Acinetobacter TaxID=469 RepID=UPI00148F4F91|nr:MULTISPECIES: entry exclusion lipoprotein TrbK [Acinetobacter]MCH7305288.1 entry exclusion lipoprotein TrbK [Acinetobacter higginsii]NNP76496.1 entry exclusion lipoprotein TrbK [Acinetobacter sp. Ac_3412]
MKKLGLILLFTFFVSACSEKMPEVNDENCKPENIRKIEDGANRADFGSKCFRRGKIEPTNRDKGY